MVKLIKQPEDINFIKPSVECNQFEEIEKDEYKFHLKYPHEFIGSPSNTIGRSKTNTKETKEELHDTNKYVRNVRQAKETNFNKYTNIQQDNLSDNRGAINLEKMTNLNFQIDAIVEKPRVFNQILKDNPRLLPNGIRCNKKNEESNIRKTNNVVYNNVKQSVQFSCENKTDHEKICNNFGDTFTKIRKSEYSSEKDNNKYSKIHSVADKLKSTSPNICTDPREQKNNNDGCLSLDKKSENNEFSEFKPLANSTLQRQKEKKIGEHKIETKTNNDDEDDIDAQFTKYYKNIFDNNEKQIDTKIETQIHTRSTYENTTNLSKLFNRNFQSKIEEKKRKSRSADRTIKEAKQELNQLVKDDFTNAEWNGETEIYTSNKKVEHGSRKSRREEEIEETRKFANDEVENELEKNPMFNRLKNIEAQIERCMTPEQETHFNKQFEEYYRASKNSSMNTRWNATVKQHSEETLYTPTKRYIPKQNERLTDPKGLFFKKRYEECVMESRRSLDGTESIGYKSSRNFWKEMEKNCPGNSSEYRTHFMNLQNKFNKIDLNNAEGNIEKKNRKNKYFPCGTAPQSENISSTKFIKPIEKEDNQQVVKDDKKIENNLENDDIKNKFSSDNIELNYVSPSEHLIESELFNHVRSNFTQKTTVSKDSISKDRSKTPIDFYENKRPKLKIEIPSKAYEKIETFAKTENDNRRLKSPVCENIQKIISNIPENINLLSTRIEKLTKEQKPEELKRSTGTLRNKTPNFDGRETRSSGGFTPTSPFYYENLKDSPIFMGMRIGASEGCKKCSVCGEEVDCDDFEENTEYVEGKTGTVVNGDLLENGNYCEESQQPSGSSPQYTQVSNNITAPPPASSGIIPPPPPANFGSIPSQMSGGPPPPPPPVFGGHIPTMRLKSEISDRKEPPAAIQNAMMTKDKKPFTYTPGGIDLSEIRSPRMQKRIVRNQNAPDTHIPQADTTKPKPVLTPTAQAAMQPQVAFPVFPSGQVPLLPAYHGNQNNGSSNVLNQNFNVSSNPVSSTSPPPPTQQHIPPPPPQRSSQLLNSPLSEGQPKANLPWLQKAPQQKELPPWVHDSSETQYGVPAQQQIDGRNTPTLQQQQYNAPAPPHVTPNSQSSIQQQPRPTPQSQSNQTTTNNRWNQQQQNKPQESQWQQSSQPQKQGQTPQQDETPAQKQWQAKQQTEIPTQKQWQGLQQTPDAPVQKQWQGTQQTEAPTQKLWQPAPQPTEIPVQKQWQVLQKTEIPTQKPWQGLQQTEIPAQKQWQGNQQSTSNQQFKTPPNQNINNSQQWQTPPPPPQRSHTPQPQVQRSFMPQPQSQENQSQPGHHVRVIPIQIEGNGSQGRWSQPSPSSPQINGNGTPIQSKSFKVLQQVTNTGSEFQESDSFTIDGIPFSQFGNIQISNEGNAKSQVPQVQVRIMTNVPRSAPQTPQPSDNASSQYSTEKSSSQTTKQFQGSTNASSHSYQVRQAVTSTQAGRPGESEY